MRALFGVLSLLVVAALVGVLAKKQMSVVNEIKLPAVAGQAVPGAPDVPVGASTVAPQGNGQQQAEQIQLQFKAAAQAAVQSARPLPDDK